MEVMTMRSGRRSAALPGLQQVRKPQAPPWAQPFIANNNESYTYPLQPLVSFFVLYRQSLVTDRLPGIYLYYPGVGAWRMLAELHELPRDQWFQVTDEDGNQWPLAMCRASSGTVTAQWLT
jgi:hypothetical protein